MTGQHSEQWVTPDIAFLSYTEVLNWIAFRRAVEADLVESDTGKNAAEVLAIVKSVLAGKDPEPPSDVSLEYYGIDLVDEQLEAWDRENELRFDRFLKLVRFAEGLLSKDVDPTTQVVRKLQATVEKVKESENLFNKAIEELATRIGLDEIQASTLADVGHYRGRASPNHFLNGRLGGLPNGWFAAEKVRKLWPLSSPLTNREISPRQLTEFWYSWVARSEAESRIPRKMESKKAIEAKFPGQRLGTKQFNALHSGVDTPSTWKEPGRRKK